MSLMNIATRDQDIAALTKLAIVRSCDVQVHEGTSKRAFCFDPPLPLPLHRGQIESPTMPWSLHSGHGEDIFVVSQDRTKYNRVNTSSGFREQ